jgi:light-regulated signal transduction histidine kinase (bacteriophytochrome)
LRKIIAFGERLIKKYKDVLGEQGQDYLKRMTGAAERMKQLITGLLIYSRVTTKAQPFKEVDLNEVIKGVLDDLEIRIKEVDGRINVEKLPVIEADSLQMRQLFQNLIGNALKFSKENIPPIIYIKSQIIIDDNDNQLCEITVQDNGIGFDPQYSERIFGVFERLHGRSEHEGTGIGLAICKKIVERHGGTIKAEGREGEGARFIIRLPMKQNST